MVFTEDWFSGYIPSWVEVFVHYGKPERVLEIGSFEGRSTCWLLERTKARMTCVDTWEGSDEHTVSHKEGLFERFRENIEPWKDRVTIMRGESGVMLRQIPCEEQYDFIYIDGSHRARDVLEDAVLAWRLLKPSGVLIFDDFNWTFNDDKDLTSLNCPRPGISAFCTVFKPYVFGMGNQLAVSKNPPRRLRESGNL
jgi:SAM-dependent methyltransferase